MRNIFRYHGRFKMSVKSKMDTLDFIINMIIEHEKKLNMIIDRLENYAQDIDNLIKRERLRNYYELEQRNESNRSQDVRA